MALNAHRVFKNHEPGTGYLSALNVEDVVDETLRSARDELRGALRVGMRDWAKVVRREELFFEAAAERAPPSLRPKFRMQGSFAYHTCNDPAQTPPQEVDLDDGVFIPMSFWMENGAEHPSLQSQGYFATVEAILKPTCDANGWTLKEKPSCVRVQISDVSHVDLALYAIPDAAYMTLVEKVEASSRLGGLVVNDSETVDGVELSDAVYTALDPEHIMLAHRDEGWKKSDPRKLEDWFNEAVVAHGDQLRRVCRYLKGWRDHQWSSSRLSSIALMWAAVTVYDDNPNRFDNARDDKALLEVAKHLPALLAGQIDNPVVEGARLDENWNLQERSTFVNGAKALHSGLSSAIERSADADSALTFLTDVFGERIPYETKLIATDEILDNRAVVAPAVLKHGLLQSEAAQPAVRDAVKKEGDNRFG